MDAQTLALAIKAAREEARKIIPERGPAGKAGRDGKPGKDGKSGKSGKDGKPGQDGDNGKDGKAGKAGKDGANGIDANRWHRVEGDPNDNLGENDDFALDGVSSNIWHKVDDEWEFVLHLKADLPMMQAPRAWSEEQIGGSGSPYVESISGLSYPILATAHKKGDNPSIAVRDALGFCVSVLHSVAANGDIEFTSNLSLTGLTAIIN